jgi:predicted small metal-binding protein
MKEFCCGDVVPGCKARFRTETEEQLMQQVAAHAGEVHGLHAIPAELAALVRQNIRDVA